MCVWVCAGVLESRMCGEDARNYEFSHPPSRVSFNILPLSPVSSTVHTPTHKHIAVKHFNCWFSHGTRRQAAHTHTHTRWRRRSLRHGVVVRVSTSATSQPPSSTRRPTARLAECIIHRPLAWVNDGAIEWHTSTRTNPGEQHPSQTPRRPSRCAD